MDVESVKSELVLILDFGSQYTHLITRRIRSLSVFSLCISGSSPLKSITDLNPRVIILSGGPHSVHTPDAPTFPDGFIEYVEKNGVFVLGICYGLQLIVQKLGGVVKIGEKQEYGRMEIEVVKPAAAGVGGLFSNKIEEGAKQVVWMSHGDEVVHLPSGFEVVAKSVQGAIASIENRVRKFYGLQYHPEALFLLSSLPDSWETMVVSISNSAPNGVLSLAVIKEGMINEELRRKERGLDMGTAYVTEHRGRGKSKGPRGRSKSRGRSQSREGKTLTCYYCEKPGHIKKNCWKMKKDNKKGSSDDQKGGSTSAVVSPTDDVVLLCTEGTCAHVAEPHQEWVVDTGASFHCTPSRESFHSYTAGDYGHVMMASRDVQSIVGIGDIHVKTNTGCTIVLKDVRHIPGLRLNLLSSQLLDKEGYVQKIANSQWKLIKGSLAVAHGEICCTLYKARLLIIDGQIQTVQEMTPSDLWHRRLAHMSEKGMKLLHSRSYISDFSSDSLHDCDYCVVGKSHRVAFKRKFNRKSCKLALVHSDVCGPIVPESLGGKKYFVTFIDDFSRKTWIYLMREKSQVFECFRAFHVLAERQTGLKLKCLRSDNGGEYTSHEFRDYYSSHGIRHEKSVPGTLQHNGVAERMNRTLVEKVRCMLKSANLSKGFWAEAVNCAVYVINRSPSVPLGYDIPEKLWTGKTPGYSHLKVFGCKAYAHVVDEHRKKLDDKAIPCIFLGYGDDEFGYRLWDCMNKKVIRSRDVTFREAEIGSSIAGETLVDSQSAPTSLDSEFQPSIDDGVVDENVDEDRNVLDDENEEDEFPDDSAENDPSPQPEHELAPVRRSERERRASSKYSPTEYVMVTEQGEPEDFGEVEERNDKKEWQAAMDEEMNSLLKNGTYELVELPCGKKALRNKWVFKFKKDGDKIIKYKARLVVKGCHQKKGIDYDEIFSPVVKMTSVRLVLSIAASLNLELEQLDVKTAFLHGDLNEELYMYQPEGYVEKGKEDLVCKLKKSLYGLKQAPRQWYRKFDSFMMEREFTRTYADPCVYVKHFGESDFIILLLYVDDMLIVGQVVDRVAWLKAELSKAFDMKDLGSAKQILGMEIIRDRKEGKIWLSQRKYIERVLKRFNMGGAKPVGTPLANHFTLSKRGCPVTQADKDYMAKVPYASAVGSLMYAMVCTRPDIAHAVGVVSRYMSNPGKEHWEAVKWIMRYLAGTYDMCLCFGSSDVVLSGYCDSDMASDLDGRKSIAAYLFILGGGAISWSSKLQKCTALSTTEAEYIAAVEAGKEMIWLKRFLIELGFEQGEHVVYCDSQSAIDLSKNTMYHFRTKHIDRKYHWIRESTEEGLFQLRKIHTDKNTADILTKTLTVGKFGGLCKLAGLVHRS